MLPSKVPNSNSVRGVRVLRAVQRTQVMLLFTSNRYPKSHSVPTPWFGSKQLRSNSANSLEAFLLEHRKDNRAFRESRCSRLCALEWCAGFVQKSVTKWGRSGVAGFDESRDVHTHACDRKHSPKHSQKEHPGAKQKRMQRTKTRMECPKPVNMSPSPLVPF